MSIALGLYGTGYSGGSGAYSSYYSTFGYGYNAERQLENLAGRKKVYDQEESDENEYNSRGEEVYQEITNFIDALEVRHKEDEALQEYNDLIEHMKGQPGYKDLDENALRAEAQDKIEKALAKRNGEESADLIKFIRDNAADEFEKHRQLKSAPDSSKVDVTTEKELLKIVCGKDETIRDASGYQFWDLCRSIGAFFTGIFDPAKEF